MIKNLFLLLLFIVAFITDLIDCNASKVLKNKTPNALTKSNTQKPKKFVLPDVMNGYEIEQTSQQFGHIISYISYYALKIKAENMTIFVTAPNYNIVSLNLNQHKYFIQNIQQFSQRKSIHKEDIEGILYSENLNKPYKFGPFTANKYNRYYEIKGVRKKLICQFDTIKTDKFSPQIMAISSELMYLPKDAGFPINYINFDIKNGKRNQIYILDSLSIKPCIMRKTEFEIPKKFKRVHSEMELFIDQSSTKNEPTENDIFREE